MASQTSTDQYNTYEGRLSSFRNAQPLSNRRTSNASSKPPKALKWPHSFLGAEEMAKAGFYYYPTQDNPDNTVCFLCQTSVDGWERDDDPLVEHLKLVPNCGWAVVASVDVRDGELRNEHPLSARMIEARKATFGDRWPHEDKKGWKCKVKQMVDAGWKYTPTPESDDMATCAYCELGLDGWEPSDKPLNEHQKRSPDCAFFALLTSLEDSKKPAKTTKARKPRASKASRVSIQSVFTTASEAPSIDDLPAEEDDSILTTATNATVTSQATRKMAKGKKPAKGRKTKAKKEETVEAISLMEPEDDDFEVKVELPNTLRGKKRASEAIDDAPSLVETQPPPAKRRGTRTTRGSVAVSVEVPSSPFLEVDMDTAMVSLNESTQAAKRTSSKGKGRRPSNTKNQLSVSAASKASLRMQIPDDDEIDKALAEDLERPLTDEEGDVIMTKVPKSRGNKSTTTATTAPIRKGTRSSRTTKEEYDMFAAGEMDIDEASIDAELEIMEMDVPKPLPKAKGAKGKQPRKPSAKQQAAAKRAAEAALAESNIEKGVSSTHVDHAPELDQSVTTSVVSPKVPRGRKANNLTTSQKPSNHSMTASSIVRDESHLSTMTDIDDVHDSGHESDASMASQSTVITGGAKRRVSALKKKKSEGKKTTSRNIEVIIHRPVEMSSIEQPLAEAPAKKPVGRPRKVVQTKISAHETLATSSTLEEYSEQTTPKATKAKVAKTKDEGKILPKLPAEEPVPAAAPQPTLPLPESPKQVPKELTPFLSPQSSDAENQPPSSKPSLPIPSSQPRPLTNRHPLQASTPSASPSRRNIIPGRLQTSQAWTAIDLDDILMPSPGGLGDDKENPVSALLGDAVNKAKKGELTSPEKKMSVEEWIVFNAGLAEERLRRECERMVGIFESEGGRAVAVLDGVVAE